MTGDLKPQLAPRGARDRLGSELVAGLVRAAATGDESAWDRLVREFGGTIWAIARAHRLTESDAADVSQVTWLRLVEHLGQLNDPARVGAWLATTARRECLRVLRHNKRTSACGDNFPDLESRETPPGAALLIRERDAALRRSFSLLRASDRALLRLLMTEPQPSYQEISAALDMPIGSIGPTRQRALERLQQELHNQQTSTSRPTAPSLRTTDHAEAISPRK